MGTTQRFEPTIKLMTVRQHHSERLALALDQDSLVLLDDAWSRLKLPGHPPTEMTALIQIWNRLPVDTLRGALRDGSLDSLKIPTKQVQILSPLPRPTSMRDGYAFRQHVEAARRNRGVPMIPEFDHFPVFYFTNAAAVTGPGPVEVQNLALDKLDFELEVAVVLGRGGKNIPAARAQDHIFGYTIMNDWSARTLQMEEMKLNLGPAKGKDFATSLGPWLVPKEDLPKSLDLRMRCWVNGKLLSEGNAKDMNWSFAQIIERASYGVRLSAGDVIGSGTVGTGCLLELNGSKITDNLWLKPGDQVDMEIEGLGRLINTIVKGSEEYSAE